MLQREAADHRAHYVCCKRVGSPAESGLEAGRPFGGSHPAGLQPGVRSLGPKQTGTGLDNRSLLRRPRGLGLGCGGHLSHWGS